MLVVGRVVQGKLHRPRLHSLRRRGHIMFTKLKGLIGGRTDVISDAPAVEPPVFTLSQDVLFAHLQ